MVKGDLLEGTFVLHRRLKVNLNKLYVNIIIQIIYNWRVHVALSSIPKHKLFILSQNIACLKKVNIIIPPYICDMYYLHFSSKLLLNVSCKYAFIQVVHAGCGL